MCAYLRYGAFVLTILNTLLVPAAFAQQNTATILGTVVDPSGATIAGAKVTATDELTGFKRSVESEASGAYLIPLMPIGANYRLTVEATGFKMFVRSGVALQLNQNARLDVHMDVGSVTESVEINANALGFPTASRVTRFSPGSFVVSSTW